MFDTLSSNGVIAAALISPPGPDVLTALAEIDPGKLTDYMRVDLLVALERQNAWLAALIQPAVAAVGDSVEAEVRASWGKRADPTEVAMRSAHAEIAAAIRLSDCAAAERLELARELTSALADVRHALAAGDITFWHARAIVKATEQLSREKAQLVSRRVLPRARHQTLGQLRRSLRRAVIAVEPRSAAKRARQAHAERSLDFWTREDGMAELRLIASATDVMTIFNVVDAIAQQARADGPKRDEEGREPIGALRADAMVTLITQGAAIVKPPAVNVTLDLPTLLGLQDNPAELAGYGPIPAELARTLAADGRWRRMILEPMTGVLLDLGHSSYKPSEPLARYVKTRDSTCIFPSCNRAARHCDIDHRIPFRPDDPSGGRTDRDNLNVGCRNHHTGKHHGRWKLGTNPETRRPRWTSPTGHTYDVEPADHRSAIAVDESPDESPDVSPSSVVAAVCPF